MNFEDMYESLFASMRDGMPFMSFGFKSGKEGDTEVNYDVHTSSCEICGRMLVSSRIVGTNVFTAWEHKETRRIDCYIDKGLATPTTDYVKERDYEGMPYHPGQSGDSQEVVPV